MAISRIKVDTGRLDQTRRELQGKLDKIRRDIDQIRDDMNTLNAMWIGEAHEAYEMTTEEDIQTLCALCDAMESVIRFENSAVTEYNKCERQVAELIAKIRI